MFKWIRKKRDERKIQLELAAKQHKYLIDCYGDIGFLQKMIELVNKDPDLTVDMILRDGTKLTLRSKESSRYSNAAIFNVVGE